MGIESDQLVYDYLSRVGDLAQQQQLSSGARMRLVSTLRGEIDRRRTTEGADSPAAVRRIIGRLGSPDELVAAAARSGDGTVPLPSAGSGSGSGEPQRRGLPRPRSGLLRKEPREAGPRADEGREATGLRKPKAGFGWGASRPDRDAGDAPEGRTGAAGGAAAAAVPRPGPAPDDAPDEDVPVQAWPDPSAPHMLGQDQQGGAGDATDWWRLEPGPFDGGTAVPGFFGGIEAPELLGRRPRPVDMDKKGEEDGKEGGPEGAGGAKAEAGSGENGTNTAARRRALRLVKLRRRKPAPVVAEPVVAAPGPRGGFAHPLLLLAAVLLIAGVVTGSWLPLAGGWLLAYSSRTLSRTEAKWAALGLPGVVAAGALVWVWGRMEGRWGEPIREGAMRDVLLEAWPVVVRVAAVASALYLVWRARRRA
ncbi:hypothetical protein K7395_14960 [Streptomyces filamentosus]|uniref:Integral membrane protein n=2 Tax=Streptomyces filamentosus TaxID=67294 RepID=A0ABY4UUK1_STRFL|nr:hypothetical protein [Streptomyces filamentosus]EFE76552.1 predicted protein [Streptomyces filamentosus NRRL 15998]MYR80529.1 hypothetical protein [Streptomyces sp. SID5466]USC47955.1 hypothetical protein K7395_14960 [Streptomyces filamentosus]